MLNQSKTYKDSKSVKDKQCLKKIPIYIQPNSVCVQSLNLQNKSKSFLICCLIIITSLFFLMHLLSSCRMKTSTIDIQMDLSFILEMNGHFYLQSCIWTTKTKDKVSLKVFHLSLQPLFQKRFGQLEIKHVLFTPAPHFSSQQVNILNPNRLSKYKEDRLFSSVWRLQFLIHTHSHSAPSAQEQK